MLIFICFSIKRYGKKGSFIKKQEESKNILILVLNQFPCFWSAWLELARLIEKD